MKKIFFIIALLIFSVGTAQTPVSSSDTVQAYLKQNPRLVTKKLPSVKKLPPGAFRDCTTSPCPEGFRCYEGKCYPFAGSCNIKKCPPNTTCVYGNCYPDPCAEVECAKNETCVNGDCVENPCFGVECDPGKACHLGECYDVYDGK
jgi:hypothetical protein